MSIKRLVGRVSVGEKVGFWSCGIVVLVKSCDKMGLWSWGKAISLSFKGCEWEVLLICSLWEDRWDEESEDKVLFVLLDDNAS